MKNTTNRRYNRSDSHFSPFRQQRKIFRPSGRQFDNDLLGLWKLNIVFSYLREAVAWFKVVWRWSCLEMWTTDRTC